MNRMYLRHQTDPASCVLHLQHIVRQNNEITRTICDSSNSYSLYSIVIQYLTTVDCNEVYRRREAPPLRAA